MAEKPVLIDSIRAASKKRGTYTAAERSEILRVSPGNWRMTKSLNAQEAEKQGLLVIGDDVQIDEQAKFKIGENNSRIFVGPGVKIDSDVAVYGGVTILEGARISAGAKLEDGCLVGRNTFIGYNAVLRKKTLIRDECVIGHLTVFEGSCHIGSRTLIHAQCHVTRGAQIEDDVFIAPLFVGANDIYMAHRRRHLWGEASWFRPYTIMQGVRIAVGVTILPGITIGRNAVIGAGAVLTKDVPENAVMIGVPAKQVGEVPEKERI